MAKIDTSKIEGYDKMTPEQKIAALEGFDHPDPDYSGYVKKDTFDATASELAALKKKNKEQLSEEERKSQEAAEKLANMEKELEGLRKDKTVSEYKAKFVAQGYAEELADATAKAMAEGDMATVFANQQKFLTEYTKTIKAETLKGTPKPPAGSGNEGGDYAKKIEDAQANGDMAAVAYYTRLQAQEEAAASK